MSIRFSNLLKVVAVILLAAFAFSAPADVVIEPDGVTVRDDVVIEPDGVTVRDDVVIEPDGSDAGLGARSARPTLPRRGWAKELKPQA